MKFISRVVCIIFLVVITADVGVSLEDAEKKHEGLALKMLRHCQWNRGLVGGFEQTSLPYVYFQETLSISFSAYLSFYLSAIILSILYCWAGSIHLFFFV